MKNYDSYDMKSEGRWNKKNLSLKRKFLLLFDFCLDIIERQVLTVIDIFFCFRCDCFCLNTDQPFLNEYFYVMSFNFMSKKLLSQLKKY